MKKIYLVFIFIFFNIKCENICVLGTGYVGLITGAVLADIGHTVICADINQKRIENLNNGIIPIYEDGLSKVLQNNFEKSIFFTANISSAIQKSTIIYITVGTPPLPNGEADLSAIFNVCEKIIENLNEHKTIIIKSTIPPGTCNKILAYFKNKKVEVNTFDIIFNPEFLREGRALYDCQNPDRIVIGSRVRKDARIQKTINNLYQSYINQKVPILYTTLTTAEMIKYASNTFLALKVSFINEIANLCDINGSNIKDISQAMGLDERIGQHFLNAGPGFGGSCFPKDLSAIITLANKLNVKLLTAQAAVDANINQRKIPYQKLKKALGNLKGKKICLLGVSFKANTDDIRDSISLEIVPQLLKESSIPRIYDLIAQSNFKKIYPSLEYYQDIYDAVEGADALLVLTENSEFTRFDYGKIANLMNKKILIDCRNIIPQNILKQYNFYYDSIGNGSSHNQDSN